MIALRVYIVHAGATAAAKSAGSLAHAQQKAAMGGERTCSTARAGCAGRQSRKASRISRAHSAGTADTVSTSRS